jgi:F-type H+-transporting ATPase subunit c
LSAATARGEDDEERLADTFAAPERRKKMKQMTAFVLTGLFLLILSGIASAAEAAGGSSAGMVPGIIALGAGLGIAIAAFGCALAQGRVGGAAMESIGRNPNSADKIFTPLILSLALIEALGIYALIIAFILAGKV